MCIMNLLLPSHLKASAEKCVADMSTKWKLGERFLYNDKSPLHSALSICEFLDNNKPTVISHPPYLPVLCDSFFSQTQDGVT